jgi:hypothetical protein
MTGGTAIKERSVETPGARLSGRLFDPGAATLEDRLGALSESLAATGSATCPVCGGRLDRVDGSRASRCSGCGSVLE